jgi:hypothetical protein
VVRSRDELAVLEARFWPLIRRGWTNTAACEAVGVDRPIPVADGDRREDPAGGSAYVGPLLVGR